MSIIDLGALKIKELEKEIQQYWDEKDIPGKWRSWSEGKPVFAFLEGPPTANGFPHVGHIRGRIYKDFVLKYYRLKGFNVWAQAGWDEQGLPVEVEVEKKLGVKKKKEISERIGLEKFVKE
ncbi:MAG: isoleucine--tRNA ligase, partial [Thermoprotei archaeon]